MAIATRADLANAKQLVDNVDKITTALAALKGKSGSYSVTVAPNSTITFDVADLISFLTAVQKRNLQFIQDTYSITLS